MNYRKRLRNRRAVLGLTEAQITMFWACVDYSDGPTVCWNWRGAQFPQGYGDAGHGYAHRVAWALYHDSEPGKLSVLHACDNRLCCNPDHLFLGTPLDNTNDMIVKKRHPFIKRHIPDAVVVAIRSSHESASALARQHGVSQGYIYLIKQGKTRKNAKSN